ncbi:MAG: fluoride efflux transporter CrcB [Alphaproteobacteria bacterium]|nr:fluoride efflux transporter CrcB [Alphaproteobacteria bacterium]
MGYLIVFLGAGIGGMARHAVDLLAPRLLDTAVFPYDTLAINVVGSLLMGLIVEYFVIRSGLSQHLRLFLTTGILGGFTTFSAFSLEAVMLWQRGATVACVLYVAASVTLSVGALFLALAIARRFLRENAP